MGLDMTLKRITAALAAAVVMALGGLIPAALAVTYVYYRLNRLKEVHLENGNWDRLRLRRYRQPAVEDVPYALHHYTQYKREWNNFAVHGQFLPGGLWREPDVHLHPPGAECELSDVLSRG